MQSIRPVVYSLEPKEESAEPVITSPKVKPKKETLGLRKSLDTTAITGNAQRKSVEVKLVDNKPIEQVPEVAQESEELKELRQYKATAEQTLDDLRLEMKTMEANYENKLKQMAEQKPQVHSTRVSVMLKCARKKKQEVQTEN